MKKRGADEVDGVNGALKSGERPKTADGEPSENDIEGTFEDEYEDEFESEDEIMEAGVDGRPDAEREEEEEEDEDAGDQMDIDNQTFIPGRHKLDPGQVLAPDLTAYEMLHSMESPWPCLSFDILRDNLGSGRTRKKYPATVYAVGGTQAARGHERENEVLVMKLSKLSKMDRPDESSDDEDEEEDAEDADPILETKSIRTGTCINRIRAHQVSSDSQSTTTLTAAMCETGEVLVHNVTPHLTAFDSPGFTLDASHSKPIHTIKSHGKTEGFALDWAPSTLNSNEAVASPKLATGDTSGRIFIHTSDQSGSFVSDARPFTGHDGSVEEIQWSHTEPTVFTSASSDGCINVWDTRSKAHKPALQVKASDTDVNVLSWSRNTDYLLASGADDGVWGVWDLRGWKSGAAPTAPGGKLAPSPVASFKFHSEQITSVEWHPTDDSVVCVAGGDNLVTLWDVAVEHDDEESRYTADAKDVPPQLLFVHYMDMVKEAHWHPQAPGTVMATGGSGFGVFKTISV